MKVDIIMRTKDSIIFLEQLIKNYIYIIYLSV